MGEPKALVDVAGKPLACRTLDRFAGLADLLEVVVVAPPHAHEVFEKRIGSVSRSPFRSLRIVRGGATRQESVARGVDHLESTADFVCVHDAARPLVSVSTIAAVVEAAKRSQAATAARRPVDSVRVTTEPGKTSSVDRSRVWLVETPQVFARAVLAEAHARAAARGVTATDDAALVEEMTGLSVTVVETEGANPKVTTAIDLEWIRDLHRTPGRVNS